MSVLCLVFQLKYLKIYIYQLFIQQREQVSKSDKIQLYSKDSYILCNRVYKYFQML